MSPSEQMAHVRFFRLLMKNEFGWKYTCRKAIFCVEPPRKCRKPLEIGIYMSLKYLELISFCISLYSPINTTEQREPLEIRNATFFKFCREKRKIKAIISSHESIWTDGACWIFQIVNEKWIWREVHA